MTVEKHCPLQSDASGTVACQRDDCAWYVIDGEYCVTQSICHILDFISETICDAIEERNDVKK
jgi:hypothetical protein